MYDYERFTYAYILMKQQQNRKRMPRPRGVPADRDQLKIRRGVMVTPKAWANLDALAKQLGYKSKSDLIEGLGRGELEVVKRLPPDELPPNPSAQPSGGQPQPKA
jgi:hypothetical protein